MTRTFSSRCAVSRPAPLLATGLFLLSAACGDGEGPAAPKDTGRSPVVVERDAQPSDDAGEPAPVDVDGVPSVDAAPPAMDAGEVSSDAASSGPGTLLNLPDDGNALSI